MPYYFPARCLKNNIRYRGFPIFYETSSHVQCGDFRVCAVCGATFSNFRRGFTLRPRFERVSGWASLREWFTVTRCTVGKILLARRAVWSHYGLMPVGLRLYEMKVQNSALNLGLVGSGAGLWWQ